MNWVQLQKKVIQCKKCPRLNSWCQKVAIEKRASYQNEVYWGKPVPSSGDSMAELLIVGLAPGAHGANRTGRMFTGDRSGDWLFRALHASGFSSEDGSLLHRTAITAIVRCAPPANKPTPIERDRCLPYLEKELKLLQSVRVVVCLGRFAWEGFFRVLGEKAVFGHGVEQRVGRYTVLGSYHPSQQNTFTGRLTEKMLQSVFDRAQTLLQSSHRLKSKSPSPLSHTSFESS